MSVDRGGRGEREKEEGRGGVRGGGGGGGGRQEAKALPPQVSTPGLLEEGGMASGGEGLLGASQEAPLRKDESGREDTGRRSSSGCFMELQLTLHKDSINA